MVEPWVRACCTAATTAWSVKTSPGEKLLPETYMAHSSPPSLLSAFFHQMEICRFVRVPEMSPKKHILSCEEEYSAQSIENLIEWWHRVQHQGMEEGDTERQITNCFPNEGSQRWGKPGARSGGATTMDQCQSLSGSASLVLEFKQT